MTYTYNNSILGDYLTPSGNYLVVENPIVIQSGSINNTVIGNSVASSGNFSSLTVNNIDVSLFGHSHTSSDITDFNSAVSGLIPVKDIIAGSNVNVSSSSGIYTISSSSIATESASLVTTVFNKTGSPIPKFSVIYISGGQGDMPTISLASASTEMTSSKTYGVTAEAIGNMTTGKVIVFGALTGVNTDQFNPTAPTGDVNGVTLYLSPTTPGGVTTTKPSAPDHMVAVGTIVRTHQNEGVVEVKIQNGFELEELHNVAISGVVDGQFLQYNTDSELWIPSSSGNFTSLSVSGTGVSVSGHTHTTSQITDFNTSVSALLPTIANSGDNRLLTSDGTSTGINAESDFTFNNNNSSVNLIRFNDTNAFGGRPAIILTRNRGTSSTDQLPVNAGDGIGSFDFRTLDSSNQNSVGAEIVAYTNTGLSSYNHVPTAIRISNRNKQGTFNYLYIYDDGTFNPTHGVVINDTAKNIAFTEGRGSAAQVFNLVSLDSQENSEAFLGWSYAHCTSSSSNVTQATLSLSSMSVPSGVTNSGFLVGHSIAAHRNSIDINEYNDNGTLNNILGLQINYGHLVTINNTSPITNNARGLTISPSAGRGTIDEAWDILLGGTIASAVVDSSGTVVTGDGVINNRYGIVQLDNSPSILNGSLTVSNGLSAPTKIYNLGTVSSNTTISYAIDKQIQTLTLDGTATNFIEGSGWPATDSVDVLLEITVSSTTSVTWTMIDDFYNSIPSTLSPGKYLVLLRNIGTTMQGHYIGEKTN